MHYLRARIGDRRPLLFVTCSARGSAKTLSAIALIRITSAVAVSAMISVSSSEECSSESVESSDSSELTRRTTPRRSSNSLTSGVCISVCVSKTI